MKGIIKKTAIIMLSALVLAGCGSAEYSDTTKNEIADVVDIGDGVSQPTSGDEYTDTSDDTSKETDARKIIFTYTYDIESKDLDKSVQAIETAVNKAGGYYEESNIDGNTKDGGTARYILKIPTDKLDSFIEGVGTFGNIVSQSKNGQDITSQYYDIESRLASLKIQQERILDLLKQADSLDDILKLESELAKVRSSIEKLTTNLKKYDSLIDYTTVKITVDQVRDYTDNNQNFGVKIIETFGDSFAFAIEAVKFVILVLIWLLPYIIVIGIIVTIAVVVDKRKRKKRLAQYRNSVPPVSPIPPVPPINNGNNMNGTNGNSGNNNMNGVNENSNNNMNGINSNSGNNTNGINNGN